MSDASTRPPRGNPIAKMRSGVVRGMIMGTVAREPRPLDEVMGLLGVSRVRVLNILADLREAGKIRGYTTRGRIVRVWR
jgi:hypothetical protein